MFEKLGVTKSCKDTAFMILDTAWNLEKGQKSSSALRRVPIPINFEFYPNGIRCNDPFHSITV